MKACSRCGFYNSDERDRCLKCKAILEHDWGAAQQKVRLRRFSFHRVTAALSNLGLNLRLLMRVPIPEDCPHRNPWLAGFLGLLPGAGQYYNRQYKKILFFTPVFVALLAMVVLTIVHPTSYLLILALLGWMLFSFNDALVSATRINGQEWTPRQTIAMFSALVFYLGVFFSLSQFFLVGIFVGIILYCLYHIYWPSGEVSKSKVWTTAAVSFGILIAVCVLGRSGNPVVHRWVYWSQNNLAPALRKGDFIYVDCVSYWFRKPRIGDIVFYNPPPYAIHQGENIYAVNMNFAIERVVGLPGDVFVSKQGEFFRNGKPVPPGEGPLHPSGLPGNFELHVPEKKYLVLISYGVSENMPIVGSHASPAPNEGGSSDWGVACTVRRGDIYGRCLFIWHPVARRQWLAK